MYVLYCATFVNGKKYIGITSNFKKRVRDHLYVAHTGEGFAFHAAIRKYGATSVSWEVLLQSEDRSEISRQEIFHIEKLNTYGNSGYNSSLGGELGGKWNYSQVLEEVRRLGIRTRSEWESRSPNSYEWAFKNLVAREIAGEAAISYKNRYWSREAVLKEISEKGIYGRVDWYSKSKNSYTYASKHNLIGLIARELGWKERNSWSTALMYEDIYSKRIGSLMQWREKGRFSYVYAQKIGLVRSVEVEMGWVPFRKKEWSLDELLASAEPFLSLKEWREQNSPAYSYAKKYKLTFEIIKRGGVRFFVCEALGDFSTVLAAEGPSRP